MQKVVIVIWLVIFVVQRHVIVFDWAISDDADCNVFDFRTQSSVSEYSQVLSAA